MKGARIVCLTAAAAHVALLVGAEEMVVTRVEIWKAKPGTEVKLEEGLKRHNELHRKQGDPKAFTTFQVQSGPNTGRYVRIAGNRRWQDFDLEGATAEVDHADMVVNVDPYLESGTIMYYRHLPDVSRPKENPSTMYSLTSHRVKFDKTDDFMSAIRKIHEGIGKTQWPVHYAWFALVNGGVGPEFVLSLPRDKWADFNPPEKPFDKMMEEAFGRSEADSINETFLRAVTGVSTEIIQYRNDLSYVPPKK